MLLVTRPGLHRIIVVFIVNMVIVVVICNKNVSFIIIIIQVYNLLQGLRKNWSSYGHLTQVVKNKNKIKSLR